MSNTNVRGRLVDQQGAPQSGFLVTAFDVDPLTRDPLGQAVTGADGRFSINYSRVQYGPIESQPDIQLDIFKNFQLVLRTQEVSDVKSAILDLGDIALPASFQGQNTAVHGRVVDEQDIGIGDLTVLVEDRDVLSSTRLGSTRTDASGAFAINYSVMSYLDIGDLNPDIIVSVFDRKGVRFLKSTQEFKDVKVNDLDVGEIEVNRIEASGFEVTLGTGNPQRLSGNNQIELIIDNEEGFRRLSRLCSGAQKTVLLWNNWFKPDFSADTTPVLPGNTSKPFVEELSDADRRGATVRILLNRTEAPVGPKRVRLLGTVDEIRASFSNLPTVRVLAFKTNYQVMHAKAVIADVNGELEAMLFGSLFEQGYWDTQKHFIEERGRGDGASGMGSAGSNAKIPIHDTSIYLRGPCVLDVLGEFVELWNHADHEETGGLDQVTVSQLSAGLAPSSTGTATVQIVQSLPSDILANHTAGEGGVLEAYQRAIAMAKDFIYLENQYFTSNALVEALVNALRLSPQLQLILVINEKLDLPTYGRWQSNRFIQMVVTLGQRRFDEQVGVFSRWQANDGERNNKRLIERVYSHTKTAVVDDVWATVGSANLDGVSLEATGQEYARTLKRNVELNALVFDQPGTTRVQDFRSRLWEEMLGIPAASLLPSDRPANGWLTLWKTAATANVRNLNIGTQLDGFVLPYSFSSGDEEDKLRKLGVTSLGSCEIVKS